jgi:hypothetical protein
MSSRMLEDMGHMDRRGLAWGLYFWGHPHQGNINSIQDMS